jgi:hypothetical protein
MLHVARLAADAAWWTAGATIVLAVLAVGTVIMAVRAYQAQNRQLTILEMQAEEQHAVSIRQMEVLELQATELRQSSYISRSGTSRQAVVQSSYRLMRTEQARLSARL